MLKSLWGDIIKKKFVVGIVVKIIIKRDNRNNTYKSHIDFINDLDNILDLLNINTNKYNISINKNSVVVELKNCNNICHDKVIKCDDYYFDNIININKIKRIDKDNNSEFYPIKLDTYIIEFINCDNNDIYAFGYSYK